MHNIQFASIMGPSQGMPVLIFRCVAMAHLPDELRTDRCEASRRRPHTLPTVLFCALLIACSMNGAVLAKDVDLAVFNVVLLVLGTILFLNDAWIYRTIICAVTGSL